RRLYTRTFAPIAEPGPRGAAAVGSRARDFAALPRTQDRQLQTQPSSHYPRLTAPKAFGGAHDAPQSFCGSASTLDRLPRPPAGKRKTPFPAHRRNSAHPRPGRDVAPRLQHHDERAWQNHPRNRSSPSKNENSHPHKRRRSEERNLLEFT